MVLNTKKRHSKRIHPIAHGCARQLVNLPRRSQHRGTITVAVLVCIVVVTTLAFSAMTICIQHRRQLRDDIRIEQTRWVLDGSVRMAISKIRNQPNYKGETLNLETPLSIFNQATVVIQTASTGAPDEVQLKVVAELHPVNRSQEQETIKWKKRYRRSANLQVSLDE